MAEQFPPITTSIFMEDKSKLITDPSWINWLSVVGSVLASSSAASLTTTIKIGTFTRYMDITSGDVAYTGIGFKPSTVVFLAALTFKSMSIGVDNAINCYCLFHNTDGTAHFYSSNATTSIMLIETNGVRMQTAYVKTFDADGFTLTWTKYSTPASALVNIRYIAFR